MAKKSPKRPSAKQKVTRSSGKKSNRLSPQLQRWLFAASIFAFAFLLYANTIGHGFVLDDDLVCKENRFVQSGIAGLGDIFSHSWYYGFSSTPDRYYRPMMLAGFAIETAFLGNEPSIYHLMNVFYYALGCAWLFLLMQLLFKDKSVWVPLSIALLFTAHPLHTEVVANIKSRDELFAFLGLLGVIYGLIQYDRKNNVVFFIVALLSYAFAILSKEAALAILGVVPLVFYFFTKTSWQKQGGQLVAFALVAVVYFGIRMQVIDPNPSTFGIFDNSLFAIESRGEQLSTAIGMVGQYFGLLLFPHPLSFDYSYNQIPAIGWGHWKLWSSLLAIGSLIYFAISGLKNKQPIAFGIILFALTFAITSNLFFLIGATFAERFMFVPLLGFCIVLTVLLFDYLPKLIGNNALLVKGLLGIVVILYSFKTVTQNAAWESDETLFETGIHTAPNSFRTQSFYGVMLYRKALASDNPTERKQLLEHSVQHLKKSIETYAGFTETYQHLAATYEAQNNFPLAIQTYNAALAVESSYFPALINMGILYYKMKNYPEAITHLKKALHFSPDHIIAHRALGLTYKDAQQFESAAVHFKQAANSDPQNVTHLRDLVNLYRFDLKDIDQAIFYDKQVKQLTGE